MSTTTGSSIRSSMLKHWRNSSIALGRSGSKRSKSEEKAAKRKSVQPVATTTTISTTKSPESKVEAPPVKAPEKPMDDSAESTNAAASSFKGTSVHVTVHIAPENVEKFLAVFKEVFDVVAAEPDCLFFEVYRSAEEPGKISWVENWGKEMQWLMENQLTKPYYKEYFEITEPMFLKPREVRILEPVGPGFTMIKASH
ncbi:uncharacterized protein GGS22DRAFT_171867 [Annulohypoxylon maeteangense]|uniref:uncharacterized protein n=1 Tax=Annulohypoxylon maeteangense TaxID=1927788 RepID=UPI002008765B|nr:uncharacterized protein GGS22DRAFT_171867 [Annulohypoxylon maeteangense]KAI0881783.1 hypothetical protein GGS22DRAFT_171867 [Annulohypoxylon maeteangense]